MSSDMIDDLQQQLKAIETAHVNHRISHSAIQVFLKNAIEVTIEKLQKKTGIDSIQKIIISNFNQAQIEGWDTSDSEMILKHWNQLGGTLGLKEFNQLINFVNDSKSLEEKINDLTNLKISKEICAPMSAPDFTKVIDALMNKSIDNIIGQLNNSNRIDKLLIVIDNDLELVWEFLSLDKSGCWPV